MKTIRAEYAVAVCLNVAFWDELPAVLQDKVKRNTIKFECTDVVLATFSKTGNAVKTLSLLVGALMAFEVPFTFSGEAVPA